jgi:hypothetical protein
MRGLFIAIIIISLFSIIRSQLAIFSIGLLFSLLLNPTVISLYKSFSSNLQKRVLLFVFIGSSLIISPIVLYFYSLQGFKSFNAFDKLIKFNSESSQSTANLGASWSVNTNPIKFIYNLNRSLWGPPIWEWRNLPMIIFGIEGLLILILLVNIIISYHINKKFRKVFFILLSAILPLWIVSSVILSNYGINSRVRAHYLLFIIPIVSAYYGERLSRNPENKNKYS